MTQASGRGGGASDEAGVEAGAAAGEGRAPDDVSRVRRLETQVDMLTEAVHALIDGLETDPAHEQPADGRAARGARLARELLLSSGQ
ncbi:hypothetical protein [Streptomyces hoynatensis]|uniref:Uncharacterized protein n=1 Tax=Streptomyces hoynatensis TaxID=1141874 RepID=A0A3A9YN27_9ACTN|nr:hypothetical protein [Streptomyces hoynatensis]RKN37530.1 hypothetical protein D7294_27730 [Streptomyces hoynatensis]